MPSSYDRNFAVTPEVVLGAAVANAGTITFPYPSGLTSTSKGWQTTGCVLVDSQGNSYSSGFTVAYGASTITVTNSSLGTLAAGRKFRLQANYYGIGQVALDPATYSTDASGNITGLVGAGGKTLPIREPKVRSLLGQEIIDLVSASTLAAGASFSGSGSYNSAGVLAVQSTGTITHNATGWYDGTACLDFVPNTDSSAEFRIYLGASAVNFSDDDGIAFRFGVPEVDTSKVNFSIQFEFSSDAVSLFPTNRSTMSVWRCDTTTATGKEKAGEQYVRQRWDHDISDANAGAWPGYGITTSGTGADRTANIPYIKFIVNKMSGKTVKFKSILKGGKSTPCLVLGSDNGVPEDLAARAFAYMALKQIPGYVTQYLSSLSTASILDRVQRIYQAGFEVPGDDTVDRPMGVDVTDEATMRSAIEATRDTLAAYGFERGSKVWVANNNSTSYLMIRELARAGYVMNRNGANNGRFVFPEGGIKAPFQLPATSIDNLNATAIQELIDRTITYGATSWLYWHGVLSSDRIDADRTANVTGTSGAPIARSGTETLIAYRARAAGLGTAAGNASVVYFDARIGSTGLGIWWEELKTVLDYIVTQRSAGALVCQSPEEWGRDVGLLEG